MTVTLSQYVKANRQDILRNMMWAFMGGTATAIFQARKLAYLNGLHKYGVEYDIGTDEAMFRTFGN